MSDKDLNTGSDVVSDYQNEYTVKLKERFLNFSVEILRFLYTLPIKKEHDVLKYQLSKSATSIGANYEEAQSSTYKEFIQKVRTALREANETKYWLEIINRLNIGNNKKIIHLTDEAKQISLILGSIVSKADKKNKEGIQKTNEK